MSNQIINWKTDVHGLFWSKYCFPRWFAFYCFRDLLAVPNWRILHAAFTPSISALAAIFQIDEHPTLLVSSICRPNTTKQIVNLLWTSCSLVLVRQNVNDTLRNEQHPNGLQRWRNIIENILVEDKSIYILEFNTINLYGLMVVTF